MTVDPFAELLRWPPCDRCGSNGLPADYKVEDTPVAYPVTADGVGPKIRTGPTRLTEFICLACSIRAHGIPPVAEVDAVLRLRADPESPSFRPLPRRRSSRLE